MNYHKPYRRILAMALSIVVMLGILPVSAAAEEPPVGASGEIISFEALPEKTANQTVPLGTSFEELDLPITLTAAVHIAAAPDAEAPEQDSGEPGQQEPEQSNQSIPVTWVSDPDYDGNAAGGYTFTPSLDLPERLTLADGVSAPIITVTVGEAHDSGEAATAAAGEITAFAALSDDVLWQSVEYGTALEDLNLPKTLSGEVAGVQAEVPVTWEAEPSYDGYAKGLYLLTAVPGEGFTASTELPVIALVVRGETPRFMTFSIGGGALDTDPFLISSAAQLAAIAGIVNEGRLEALFLGLGVSGQVYLKLENDIDLSGYTSGGGWMPIGNNTNQFKGSFDGNSHTITGLTINRSSADHQGLFGYLLNGTVKNLGMANVSITGRGYVGGIVGLMNQAAVRNCYTTGSIKGMAHVGGVAGYVYGSGSALQSCYSTADVTGTDTRIGGIAGFVDQSTMKDCAALNPFVSGKDSNTGRVAGQIATSLNVSGNIAFIGMTMTVNGVTQTISGDAGNGKNGADKYTDTIRLSDGTLDGLFTAAGGWTTEYGKLPGFGAAVDMPIHLLGSSPFEGSGSNGDPYQISTAAQLARLAELVNAGTAPYAEAGKFYLLMNDLDLSGYASGEGWVPIGKNTSPYTAFKGSFNGNGKTITGLTINRPGTDYQGLFGYLDAPAAELKNLGVAGASISGKSYVGGVAGYINSGTVQNCFVNGSVNGGNNIGGVVGVALFSTVQNCYMDGSVTGWGSSIGGIVGSTADTVQNCYVIGSITGDSEVGGVAGNLSAIGPGVVKNSAALCLLLRARTTGFGRVTGNNPGLNITGNVAFDGMTALLNGAPKEIYSAQNASDGENKTADEISAAGFFQTLFGNNPAWTYGDGKLPGLNGQAIPMPLHLLPAGQNPFGGGGGSDGDPYQISTPAQLARLAQMVNAGNITYNANGVCYKLMNDLDLSDYASGEGWVPIGNNTNPFKGSFDGNHKIITGLTINRTGTSFQGLFGLTDTGSLVQNLGVENVSVRGGDYLGGVAGIVSGTVQSCYSTGSISGAQNIGGVAGNVAGTAENCYSTADVSGASAYVGGVAGRVAGTAKNCYSTGSVSGANSIGGVAGNVSGLVENCAALNPLVSASGNIYVGRVAGDVSGDNRLQNNYAYSGMTVTGQSGPKSITDSATGTDGKSRDKAALQAAGGFPHTSGTGDIFGAAPWTYTAGRLPGFGAAVDMPLHLINFSTTPLTVALSGTGVSGSGTSYSAPFSSSDRPITVIVTGWEDWTNQEVTVTAKKPNNDAIAVTPQDTIDGSASFVLPGNLSGNFTITAAAKSNPNNVKTTLTLTVSATPVITASAGAGGSISPSGPVNVPAGGNQTFAVAPGDGHIIASVTVDGVNRGAISSYTFTNVTGDHTISAAFTTEQFSLSPGGTYYFDLSGQGIPDTVNTALLDTSLKWVPFTYAGAVNAYSLDASSSGDVSASGNAALSDRSLFVADYNLAHTVSWDDLNAVDLIFGKNYMMGGIEYKLRSLSAGSTTNGQSGANERGMPGPNEWDQLLNKDGGFIKNWNDKLTWGQDTSMGHFSARAVRGYFSARIWYDSTSSDRFADIGFRPILEVLNPGMLGTNGLKTVTYNMGGNGRLGGGSLISATVVYTGTPTLPEITSANGFTYTGSGTGTLGWWSGGTFYAPGAAPGLAMGVTLTAGYEFTTTPLAVPTGLSWDGTTPGKATWGAVANASSYSVQLYKDGGVQGSPVSGITATEYNFASVIASAGTGSYTFRVTAIGDGTNYTDSGESAASAAYTYTSSYTITASAGSGGSISPGGPVTVPAGGSQTFTIAPGAGHIIASVTVDGVNRGAISSYTFTNVTGAHTISAAFTTEQFSLSPGGTYYFDLSGQGIPGTINYDLPDTSLKWVPFTYAGTVNAYSLDASSSGDVSASGNAALSDRSLFVADYNVAHTVVSWDDLNAADLIFGKNYMMGDIEYKLRSLSMGSVINGQPGADERGMPVTNEWDQLLNKDGSFIKNWSGRLTWGQDTSSDYSSYRAIRGYSSVRAWDCFFSSSVGPHVGFRPALEILNPGMPGPDGLKTVIYNMGGDGRLGGGSLTSATVVYTGTLTLPEITSANGFTYTGSGTGTLGWWSGGTFYAPGAAPGLAMGVTLTAGYEFTTTPLAVPTGLSWDGTTPGKATWGAVANTSSYSVQLYKGGAVQGSPVNSGTATEYNFASIIASAGTDSYTFRVTAIGDSTSYTDSAESAASSAYTYTSGTTTYTIIASAGSGGSISPSGTVSVAEGGSQTFTITSANSNYSISNVTVDNASQGAIATYSFTNVRGNHTISVTFRSTGGNSGGGSSGGDNSSGNDTAITIQPVKKPDQPVIAGFSVTPTVDAKGHATISISQKDVESAVKKALADAKAQGKTENGIGISVNLGLPDTVKSLGIVLPRTTLKSLIDAGVKQFEIGGVILSLDFDKKALDELYSQSTGDITITVKPAQNLSEAAQKLIGTRPVYEVTVSYVKDGKTESITSLGNGSVTLSIPYTPGQNEAVGYLFGVYIDGNGHAARIPGSTYDADSRSVILGSNHFSVYGVGYTAPTEKYTDIATHWARESIDYAVGRGLFSGTTDTTFSPDTPMERGMLVTALGRQAGADVSGYKTSSFSDVSAGKYYLPYVEWTYKMGIVSGIGNGKFEPERAVTREEIAVIFANYAKATGYTLPITREAITFADSASIGSSYQTAVKAMQQAGIVMGGSGNRFNPKSGATRAEVSSMLHRYIKLTIDPATAQGWAKNDAGQYLYYRDGKALTGWQTIGGVKYYFETTGNLKTGWVKDDAGSWYFYSGSTRLTGWRDIGANGSNKRYYFDTNAVMVSGKWLEIDGKWYYFNTDGSLARNTEIDGYEVDENGVRKTK